MVRFEKLRVLSAFEKQHLDFFSSVEDHHLIAEIGYHQSRGEPLTLKQLFLLNIGSVATVQRRLRRLKELGLVLHRRSPADRRAVELSLSAKSLRIIAKYDALMGSAPPAGTAAGTSAEPGHLCGLCDSDAGARMLLAAFLGEGLKRGDRCLLVAPADAQKGIVAQLGSKRGKPVEVIVSDGYRSADAQVAFLLRVSREATQAGRKMCLAAQMSWTRSKGMAIDSVLDIESRFDAFARQNPLNALCVYDTRLFSSGDFLRAVRCHHDHARVPIQLC